MKIKDPFGLTIELVCICLATTGLFAVVCLLTSVLFGGAADIPVDGR